MHSYYCMCQRAWGTECGISHALGEGFAWHGGTVQEMEITEWQLWLGTGILRWLFGEGELVQQCAL